MKLTIICAVAALLASPLDTQAQTADQRFESCRSTLKRAKELDVLYALDWKSGEAPYVVAGPTFLSLPIDAKTGFAEAVHCFLNVGETGNCLTFDILHWQTGNAIGTFANCRYRHI